jgi:hypothetical protein
LNQSASGGFEIASNGLLENWQWQLTDDTRSRTLTAFPGGLAIAIVKILIIIGTKITFLEFFHQILFFHGTAFCGF